jgi:MFS superfamily sulfate permease-like transporter
MKVTFLTGMIVISALLFFTPYLKYIPKPALAAIVVCAVVHMIEYEEAIHIWRTKSIRKFFSTSSAIQQFKICPFLDF